MPKALGPDGRASRSAPTITAVMYHYVRPTQTGLPFFRYLHVDDFRRQLDHFAATIGFAGRDAFLRSVADGHVVEPGAVMTFDDGLAEHHEQVLPELMKRRLWGFFYIPTGPYATGTLLDVHRLHVIIGMVGGQALLDVMSGMVSADDQSEELVATFRAASYAAHDDDQATITVKRFLNYTLPPARRHEVMDKLAAHYFGRDEADLARSFYLNARQIRDLCDAGMVVGSHSVTHPPLGTLGRDEQIREIDDSLSTLESMAGRPIRDFCCPFGIPGTFTAETQELLAARGVRYCFAFDPRDVTDADLATTPMALPRYDCNQFPHGKAWMGSTPPAAAH